MEVGRTVFSANRIDFKEEHKPDEKELGSKTGENAREEKAECSTRGGFLFLR